MLGNVSLTSDVIIDQNLLIVQLGLFVDGLRNQLKVEESIKIQDRDLIKDLKNACKIVSENDKFNQIIHDHFLTKLNKEKDIIKIEKKPGEGFDVMVRAGYDLSDIKYEIDFQKIQLKKFE